VFRPTGFADLAGKRVGIFGYGVEGRAAAARLREIADLVLVDDHPEPGSDVLVSGEGGLDALLQCDVVLKSPGIPRRRADVVNLDLHGVTVTSALNLWLHETDRARVVALTGTKGKSTTTALVAFFFALLGPNGVAPGHTSVSRRTIHRSTPPRAGSSLRSRAFNASISTLRRASSS